MRFDVVGVEGRDSVADPCYIGGAGYGLVV